MTESEDKQTLQERVDFSNPITIAVGFIPIILLISCVPVFWLFLPFVIIALVILYLLSANGLQKARALAKKHCAGSSDLYEEFSLGLTSAMVLNDWGVVYTKLGIQPIELSWQSLRAVEEPSLATLVFYVGKSARFQLDLTEDRYFLAVKSIHSKIPDKTLFAFNPKNGTSNLGAIFAQHPYEWRGKWGYLGFNIDGIRHKKGNSEKSVRWEQLDYVDESEFQPFEAQSFFELKFHYSNQSIIVASNQFSDDLNTGTYDLIKMIVELMVPEKRKFINPATATNRAEKEFNRTYESTKAAFSFAVKSGKWDYIERMYKHCLWLLDTFQLQRVPAETFLIDYAELLKRTNRESESAKLLSRSDR